MIENTQEHCRPILAGKIWQQLQITDNLTRLIQDFTHLVLNGTEAYSEVL